MSIEIKDNLSSIIKTDQDNDYTILNSIDNAHGVYIFRCKSSGEILYVGEAREQSLKKRIVQNFTASDTGGTFRDNYISSNECSFVNFSEELKSFGLIVIKCPNTIIITALEAILINVLSPKYNKIT